MKLRNIIATSSLIMAGAGIAHAADIVLECQACPSGTYTDGTSGVCSQCPSGTYSTGGAESCSACSSPTYSSWFTTISYKEWTGPFWYEWHTERITPTCGSATRTKTTYCTKAGSTSSTANPSSSDESGNAGTCGAGQTCTSGNCVACSAGYYKASSGNGACTACPDPTYSNWYTTKGYLLMNSIFSFEWRTEKVIATCGNATRTKTTYCASAGSTSSTANLSYSDESGNAGTCGAGQTCSSGSCVSCSVGTYKSTVGNEACTSCSNKPSNSHYTTSNSCNWECDNGYDKVQKIYEKSGLRRGMRYERLRSNYGGSDIDIIGDPECKEPITYSYCEGGSVSSSNRVITVHENAHVAKSSTYDGSRCLPYGGCCVGESTGCFATIEDRVETSGQTNISIFKPNCNGRFVKNGDYI